MADLSSIRIEGLPGGLMHQAEIGDRTHKEFVEIQVGRVERIVQSVAETEGFDLARQPHQRVADIDRARAGRLRPARRSPLSASTTSTSPLEPLTLEFGRAENLHRGNIHVRRGEQSQSARRTFGSIMKSEIRKTLPERRIETSSRASAGAKSTSPPGLIAVRLRPSSTIRWRP